MKFTPGDHVRAIFGVAAGQTGCIWAVYPNESIPYLVEFDKNEYALLNQREEELELLEAAPIRQFETGATRDADKDKLKIEGFIDPLVDKRYSQYMHKHRLQPDGNLRAPDNWQKGIPLEAYGDSLVRHVLDFRLHFDGYPQEAVDPDLESVLCAIIFNARGYLFETLKKKEKQNGIS